MSHDPSAVSTAISLQLDEKARSRSSALSGIEMCIRDSLDAPVKTAYKVTNDEDVGFTGVYSCVNAAFFSFQGIIKIRNRRR